MSDQCCINDCDRPGTVHANHPGASLYCTEHGVCGYCGESVEFFVHCQDLHIWICPCVEKRRKQAVLTRPEYNPLGIADFVDKKPKASRSQRRRSA